MQPHRGGAKMAAHEKDGCWGYLVIEHVHRRLGIEWALVTNQQNRLFVLVAQRCRRGLRETRTRPPKDTQKLAAIDDHTHAHVNTESVGPCATDGMALGAEF